MNELTKEDFNDINAYLCASLIFDKLGDITVEYAANSDTVVLTLKGLAAESELYGGNMHWPKCDNGNLASILNEYVSEEATKAGTDKFEWGLDNLTMSSDIAVAFYINTKNNTIHGISVKIMTDFGHSAGDGAYESYWPMDDADTELSEEEEDAAWEKLVDSTKFTDIEGLNNSLKTLVDKYV